MSRMLSRWPVVVSITVNSHARDGGTLSDAAIERLSVAARDEYLSLCTTVDASHCEYGELSLQRGGAAVGSEVTVSAAALELFESGFTMAGRIRGEADAIVADTRCFVAPAGGITDAMRDELIAIVHAAAHWH